NNNGYSDDEDEDLHFQDDDYNDDDDVDMAYISQDTLSYANNTSSSNSNSNNNNSPFDFSTAPSSASNGLYNNNTNQLNTNPTSSQSNNNSAKRKDSLSEQPKERKKPGRKPGATCPALRKEQNRAAQRAFRDRKERHLHQLENMIKDLKNQHFLVTSRLQREAHDLKAVIESLQSENFYLREVVFAFESALSKGNYIDILKTVKQELFRRHHQNRASSATPSATPSSPGTDSLTPPPNIRSSFSPSASTTLPTTPVTSVTAASVAAGAGVVCQGPMEVSDELGPVRQHPINDDLLDESIPSMSGNILYKAPPLFFPDMLEKGQPGTPISPYGSISVPRPAYCPPGTILPGKTEYTKHANVFEELQSSLFPPGTLESLHISMATPQEVVSEETPFAETIQTDTDRHKNVQYDNNNSYNKGASSSSDLPMHIKVEPDTDDETPGDFDPEQLRRMAAALGLRMETSKRHRLHRELQILISAEPQTDPNIDPKVYELPHDRRIDFVPCPKLRAQMIVHQQRYNADELFQLLIDEAVCHGPPLHKDSWQLPEAFFDRFGFLLGLEFDRIRRKMWPVKYAE
ncbi:hypothetical protein BGX23_000362, partial [Mortierella sp. AD031]